MFLVTLTLTGCWQSSESGGNALTGTAEEYTGVVKPLGVSIYQEGTHRLEVNGALKVILMSNQYNLYNFEEAEVAISGPVRDTITGGQRIMNVTQLELIKDAENRVKQTQTFTSGYHSFRFEYPTRWKLVSESQLNISFDLSSDDASDDDTSDDNLFVMNAVVSENGFAQWLRDLSFTGYALDAETLIRVDGRNATRRIYRDTTDTSQQIISISLPIDKTIYHFIFDSRATNDIPADKAAFYNLIDGFTFSLTGKTSTNTSVTTKTETATDSESKITVDTDTLPAVSVSELTVSDSVVSNPNLSSEAVDSWVTKGMTRFESSSLKFGIDVPKAWYYSGFSGVTGVIYRYGFTDYKTYKDSNDDVNLGNAIVTLDIVTGNIEDVKKGNKKQLGSNVAYIDTTGSSVTYYLKRDDNTSFVFKGDVVLQGVMEQMAVSIRVQ
jgi:hypothetical protein